MSVTESMDCRSVDVLQVVNCVNYFEYCPRFFQTERLNTNEQE